jgi:hypothetical protein
MATGRPVLWTAARRAALHAAITAKRRGKVPWRDLAKDFGVTENALRTMASKLDWSPKRHEHERARQRDYRRQQRAERLAIEHRAAALLGRVGRITKIERAGQVSADREQERIAMATRNARMLYEVALLRSANPTHALMGDPPLGCSALDQRARHHPRRLHLRTDRRLLPTTARSSGVRRSRASAPARACWNARPRGADQLAGPIAPSPKLECPLGLTGR